MSSCVDMDGVGTRRRGHVLSVIIVISQKRVEGWREFFVSVLLPPFSPQESSGKKKEKGKIEIKSRKKKDRSSDPEKLMAREGDDERAQMAIVHDGEHNLVFQGAFFL